ncbi:hypothetical protein [Citricoccus sp. GCM10030269]|uniref:hypothetical protein n=1 Tax=Citricoccus sp. GCM10030269 TaxID=3273388 RepID=UPI00360BDAA5
MSYPPHQPEHPGEDRPEWYQSPSGPTTPPESQYQQPPYPPQQQYPYQQSPYQQGPYQQYPYQQPQQYPYQQQPGMYDQHRQPGQPYPQFAPAYSEPGMEQRKPHSHGFATVGWILTVLFGLVFILFFFAGVSAFNDNASASESGAYNFGVFLGFFLLLLAPALPILLGIRLIRQPKRQPPIR